MPMWFQRAMARFRYMFAAETIIEAKHVRGSLARKAHYLGPVRVSLANRLPLLEKWLLKGQARIADIVDCFGQSRDMQHAAARLGLRRHPSLLDSGEKEFRTKLAMVLYNCSLSSMYRSFLAAGIKAEAKHNMAQLCLLPETPRDDVYA